MDELEEELRNEIESLKEKNGLLEDENKDLNDLIVKMSDAAYEIYAMK